MNREIKEFKNLKIVYFRQIGEYGDKNISLMEKLKSWAEKENLLDSDAVIYGIVQDNPTTTKAEECRYDVGIVVAPDYIINNNDTELSTGVVKGGKYLVFTTTHTEEAVQRTWLEIFMLIDREVYNVDLTRPILERYAIEMLKNNKCEICLPIIE